MLAAAAHSVSAKQGGRVTLGHGAITRHVRGQEPVSHTLVLRDTRTARSRQSGFTLAELGLVIVIIGLAMMGLAYARTAVTNGQSKKLVHDINGLRAGYELYQARYRAMPGDDPGAGRRWAGVAGGNGDRKISGRYSDEHVGDPSMLVVNGTRGESLAFWWHLRLAGIVPGPSSGFGAVDVPRHALGGMVGVQGSEFGGPGPVVCFDRVPVEHISFLESNLDDGRPNAGAIRAGTPGQAPIAAVVEQAGLTHVVCATLSGPGGGS
jgi:hypothetical protein